MTFPTLPRAEWPIDDSPAVEMTGLRKEFRRRVPKRDRKPDSPRRRTVVAIERVTMTIARGETVAILGQNGSGKSTLVRLLSTLLLHDGGTARVFGHDVFTDQQSVRRLVNRVSVEASFFKKMSATENLSYASRFYGMPPRETRVEIPRILDRVGFPERRRNEPMENLSRGMQQKVALARALLTAPVLLLLDEPTTGLDPRSKREVQAFIREVRAVHDATTLLCTHDLAEAEVLADRIGIIDRGRMLILAEPEEVLRHYHASSLEEAFFAASGRDLAEDTEDEEEDDEIEREVLT
jgi:ABC-2 type transport system ATP-binding protein